MSQSLIMVCVFTFFIHWAETTAYAIRLAGVRTRLIASSISFVNATFLVSRLSNMFQAPLLGAMVDRSSTDTLMLASLGSSFRMIIVAAMAGSMLGFLLLPNMTILFTAALGQFRSKGSLLHVIGVAARPRNLLKILKVLFKRPAFLTGEKIEFAGIPKTFLIINVVMTAIYTVGVLASLYAGARNPEFRATAIQLSGIVNGIATLALVLFVDPGGAHIVDGVVDGKRPMGQMWGLVLGLGISRLIGVGILSQIIFLPATYYIEIVARLIVGAH